MSKLQNLIEKSISVISPKWAVARREEQIKLNYYDSNHKGASRTGSLADWMTPSGDSDVIDTPDLETLRDRCADLNRNSDIAKGAIDTILASTVGVGLKVQSSIDNEFLGISQDEAILYQKKIERIFNNVANSKNSSSTRMSIFGESQDTAFREMLVGGDCFALFPQKNRKNYPYKTCIKLINASKCITPSGSNIGSKIVSGVEMDKGELVAYHFKKANSDLDLNQWETLRIPAFDKNGNKQVHHLLHVSSPNQRRGLPLFSAAIESFKLIIEYTTAELVSAVVSGKFTGFVKTSLADNILRTADDQEADGSPIVKIGNGTMINLERGEDVDFANPGRPNTAYGEFVKQIYRGIGASIGVPYEILMKHFESSYTSARASFLEVWRIYKIYRWRLAVNFCQPFYEAVITEAVLSGELELKGFLTDWNMRQAWLKTVWNGTGMGQINEKIETVAAQLRVANGFSTIKREAIEINGTDADANIKKAKSENEAMIKSGLKKEEKVA